MNSELATTNGDGGGIDLSTLEKVVVQGDLSRLSPGERLAWYRARCDAAGLDPRTQPFQYLNLQGKLTLYATKAATDQLIANRRLTTQIIDRRLLAEVGIYEVQCRVTFPDGHFVEDVGALNVAGFKGDALCNAVMKCVTKAKRRTVLSACGLGMLDETEVETIPDATRPEMLDAPDARRQPKSDNGSGFASGHYASPEDTERYLKRLRAFVDASNGEWADWWTNWSDGERPEGFRELMNIYQADGHLLKWCQETGRLEHVDPSVAGKHRVLGRYTAIVYFRSDADAEAMRQEMTRYKEELARRATEAIYRKHPELRAEIEGDAAYDDTAIDDDDASIETTTREPGDDDA
jgi:hypothetical protein